MFFQKLLAAPQPLWSVVSTLGIFHGKKKTLITRSRPRHSGKPKRFCTKAVNSRIRRPFSPRTSRVLQCHDDSRLHCYFLKQKSICFSNSHVKAWYFCLNKVNLFQTVSPWPQCQPPPSGPDDDLSTNGSDTHFHTGIAIFTKCACQELIQLGVENASKLQKCQKT